MQKVLMRSSLIFSVVFSVFFLLTGCAKKGVETGTVMTEISDQQPEEQAQVKEDQPQQQQEEEEDQEVAEEKSQVGDGSVVGSVYFDFDKYNIRSDMQGAVNAGVKAINDNSEMNVLIEGNTDEFGSNEYNFALGNKRALAIKSALVTRGIDKNKIKVVSLGKTKPVCVEKTSECYQKNRRGDIRLTK